MSLRIKMGYPSPPCAASAVSAAGWSGNCSSNDNPYSESQFRTLKYRPEFPDRFGCIQDSRAFCQRFFRWYNGEHRHSSLGLLTPAMVHYNQTDRVLQQRQQVLDAAYQLHPERFVRSAPKPPAVPTEAWINKPIQLT